MMPRKAMVLAAGRGERMGSLTDNLPKVLIEVAGKPLIDYVLDQLADAGVEEAVVNHHYLAEMLLAHLEDREGMPKLTFSDEHIKLLETGGGTANALSFFAGEPFFAVNADAIWQGGGVDARTALADAWDGDIMDALLLLVPKENAVGLDGPGDYLRGGGGRLVRKPKEALAPYFYAGTQIVHPRLFEGCPEGPFSFNILWDKAQAQGRLFGVVHDGTWLHVGTPQGRDEAENILLDG